MKTHRLPSTIIFFIQRCTILVRFIYFCLELFKNSFTLFRHGFALPLTDDRITEIPYRAKIEDFKIGSFC